MNDKNKVIRRKSEANASQIPKQTVADSNFELVLLASQRCRQLVNGAETRICVPDKKTRNTRLAVKEIELGLIDFTAVKDD